MDRPSRVSPGISDLRAACLSPRCAAAQTQVPRRNFAGFLAPRCHSVQHRSAQISIPRPPCKLAKASGGRCRPRSGPSPRAVPRHDAGPGPRRESGGLLNQLSIDRFDVSRLTLDAIPPTATLVLGRKKARERWRPTNAALRVRAGLSFLTSWHPSVCSSWRGDNQTTPVGVRASTTLSVISVLDVRPLRHVPRRAESLV